MYAISFCKSFSLNKHEIIDRENIENLLKQNNLNWYTPVIGIYHPWKRYWIS